MELRNRAVVLLTVLTGPLVIAACSSDESADPPPQDAAPSTSAPADADRPALCDNWVEVDAVTSELGGPETPPEAVAAVATELQALLDVEPPQQVAADLEVTRTAAEAAAAGDPSAFESPELVSAAANISNWVHEECGFETVDLTYEDYAFSGLPADVAAGPVSFRAVSAGSNAHVMVLGRLTDDAAAGGDPIAAVTERLSSQGGEADLEGLVTPVVSGAFATPGATSAVTADLEPGTYVVFCPLPVGFTGDGPPPMDAPSHASQGMVAAFDVE